MVLLRTKKESEKIHNIKPLKQRRCFDNAFAQIRMEIANEFMTNPLQRITLERGIYLENTAAQAPKEIEIAELRKKTVTGRAFATLSITQNSIEYW